MKDNEDIKLDIFLKATANREDYSIITFDWNVADYKGTSSIYYNKKLLTRFALYYAVELNLIASNISFYKVTTGSITVENYSIIRFGSKFVPKDYSVEPLPEWVSINKSLHRSYCKLIHFKTWEPTSEKRARNFNAIT